MNEACWHLVQVLKGLGNADNQQRSVNERELDDMSKREGFPQALVTITNSKEVDHGMRQTAAACLSDFVRSFYLTNEVSERDREFLRSAIMDCITLNYHDQIIGGVFCSVLDRLVASDFPDRWRSLPEQTYNKLYGSSKVEELFGSLTAVEKLVKSLTINASQHRQHIEELAHKIFPLLETLVSNQVNDWNQHTTDILLICLKTLLASITVEIPDYFSPNINSHKSLQVWLNTVQTVVVRTLPSLLITQPRKWEEHLTLENHPEWRLKKVAMQVLTVLSHHARERSGVERDPAAILFAEDWALNFLDKVLTIVSSYNRGEYVSSRVMTFALKFVNNCLSLDRCASQMKDYLEQIMLDFCLPLLAVNEKDYEYWKDDPAQYIYSENCKTDDHNMMKNAADDLISKIADIRLSKTTPPMVYNLINFIYESLDKMQNIRTKQAIDPFAKEYLLHAFQATTDSFKLDKNIRSKLEDFSARFIIPEMLGDNELLKARCCWLYSRIGYFFQFKQRDYLLKMCQGISSCLSQKNLVVKVAAAEAMSVLLKSKDAQDLMRPDLDNILKIILQLLKDIEYDGTISALEAIIDSFEADIAPHSDRLLEGLGLAYVSYKRSANCNNSHQHGDNEEDVEGENERAASACLDTMANLLSAKLSQETYRKCINPILEILNTSILVNDQVDFHSAIALLNLLVYKNEKIQEILVFYFPILCYLIVGKPNKNLQMDVSAFPDQMQEVLSRMEKRIDFSEDVEIMTACMLNFFQKTGDQFLNGVDFYGESFIDLVFEVAKTLGQEGLDAGRSHCLQYALKLLAGLLENFKGKVDNILERILNIVAELLNQPEKSNASVGWCESLLCSAIWYNAEMTIRFLKERDLVQGWFESLILLTSEQDKERKIYALTEFLVLPQNLRPANLNLKSMIQEIFVTCEKVVESKKYDLEDKDDYESGGSEYSDLYDDEDDLWEEVEIFNLG